MDSWAREQAGKIKSAERKKEEDRLERTRLNEILRSDSKPFFCRIGEYIRQHVNEFSTELNAPTSLRCECYDDTISIVKESLPRIALTLNYCAVPFQVTVHQVTTASVFPTVEEHADATLRFALDSDGQLCLDSKDPDSFARAVLKPIFEAFDTSR